MAAGDPLGVVLRVVGVLERLGVPYALGGSLASSLHGLPRATLDADIAAALLPEHVGPLVADLTAEGEFYLDEQRARDAVARSSSVNAIHLGTGFKVDLFVVGEDRLGRRELERAERIRVGEDPGEELRVATAEDIVLQKLAWFRLGNEVSERQWSDLVGVLKVKGPGLDLGYLEEEASHLGLVELLRRALAGAR